MINTLWRLDLFNHLAIGRLMSEHLGLIGGSLPGPIEREFAAKRRTLCRLASSMRLSDSKRRWSSGQEKLASLVQVIRTTRLIRLALFHRIKIVCNQALWVHTWRT